MVSSVISNEKTPCNLFVINKKGVNYWLLQYIPDLDFASICRRNCESRPKLISEMLINMVRFSIRRKPETKPQNQPPPEMQTKKNVAKTTPGDTSTSDEEPKGFAQAFAAHQV